LVGVTLVKALVLIKSRVLIESLVGVLESFRRLLGGEVFGVSCDEFEGFVEQHKGALPADPGKWIEGVEAVFRHGDSPLRTTNGFHCTTGFGDAMARRGYRRTMRTKSAASTLAFWISAICIADSGSERERAF